MTKLKKLILDEKRFDEAKTHLVDLRDSLPEFKKEIDTLLAQVRKLLKDSTNAVEKMCPHTVKTEGPHDDSFCDMCGHLI